MSRYWLHAPQGRIPLPGTLKPTQLAPVGVTPNLQRARGYTQLYDLSDRLPDPAPLVLQGVVRFDTEDELNLYLRELQTNLRNATAFDRDGRTPINLLWAHVLPAPTDSGHSGRAHLTITFIPAAVPDPASTDPNFW